MSQDQIEEAYALMRRSDFAGALSLLRAVLANDPSRWEAWYMAGQSCRMLHDLDGAIECLTNATAIRADQPHVLMGLGVALQLRERWFEAIDALGRAIEIDGDYAIAFNSLALTQKKMGRLTDALRTYESGAEALARQIAKSLRNDPDSPRIGHRDTKGTLWVRYAIHGAVWLVSRAEGIDRVVFPSAQQAIEEQRTGRNGGRFWVEQSTPEEDVVRLYLPNFFDAFREALRRDRIYADLTGNRGTVLAMLGQQEEADQHISEATEFLP